MKYINKGPRTKNSFMKFQSTFPIKFPLGAMEAAARPRSSKHTLAAGLGAMEA